MNDYPPEYDQENLDNKYLAEAFPDAKGLGDLYRQTHKYTECGLWLSAKIMYVKVLEPDGFDDYPHEQEVEEWIHSDDLYRLGTWADMDSKGVLVTALKVGGDYGADQLEINQLDEWAKDFAKRFYEAVKWLIQKEVNDERI